jgi:hypothetical protein
MKWLIGILLGLVLPLLLAELSSWVPWLAHRVVRRAARHLPDAYRERYEEEWLAELEQVPANLPKLSVALSLYLRVDMVRRALARNDVPKSTQRLPVSLGRTRLDVLARIMALATTIALLGAMIALSDAPTRSVVAAMTGVVLGTALLVTGYVLARKRSRARTEPNRQ